LTGVEAGSLSGSWMPWHRSWCHCHGILVRYHPKCS
jgi:hypothetical protein